MNIELVLGIITVALLVLVAVLLAVGKSKSGFDKITDILRKSKDDQRDAVARQIGDGTTEQFKRFGVIQESIQTTLQSNREETTKQLREFQVSITSTLESKMKALQDSNEKRLEQMQGVVDEKLQKTLETRLAQSFELVSKQLDSVQQGLGEMKNLAADTKSLRNALTNVKERGTYGEVRLEKLLADMLAPGQYEVNVEIADRKRVEFAVKLPGHGEEPLLLPIDAKFPIEDYNRIIDAEDKQAIEEARKSLAQTIRLAAKDIKDKYIIPPKTTDFALMFLPTEGLYAEVVQNVSLFEELRTKYKVVAVGATTLSAFLDSLQMGFKTLSMEKRSMEVWDTLRAVKAEFVKFSDMLERAHKQIQTADKTLETLTNTRAKAMHRRLRSVEEPEGMETPQLLESGDYDNDDSNDDNDDFI